MPFKNKEDQKEYSKNYYKQYYISKIKSSKENGRKLINDATKEEIINTTPLDKITPPLELILFNRRQHKHLMRVLLDTYYFRKWERQLNKLNSEF
jgi:hypothetical protein